MRSASRPGQATTISVRARRAATCRLWGVPPKTVTTVSPTAWASGARTAWTWLASSRVGTSTRPRGRQAMVWPPANAVTSGIENAIVLPEPVRPRPSTSRPASASGSVAAWIGKGVVIPASVSTPATGAGTPRDAKLTAPAAAATVRRLWRPRWAALEFSMGRTVKRMSFGLGWPHCLGPPRPWKPVRSPSDVRPARPDGCASLRTVYWYRTGNSTADRRWSRQRPDRSAPVGGTHTPRRLADVLAVLGLGLSPAEPKSCMGQAHLMYDVGAGRTLTTTGRDEHIRLATTSQRAQWHAYGSYRIKRRCPGGQPCLRSCAGLRWRKRHAARTLQTRVGHHRAFGAASP